MIHFVGAGPGAEDLITVRGQQYLKEADIIIYAGSLVNPGLLQVKKEGCEVYNSAYMTLEEVLEVMYAGEKEGKRILENIKDGSFVIALAIDGAMLDSVELAGKIEKWGISGVSQLVFIIGGSLGLSKEVLSRADYKLSFSKMTFPHQLMRVILLEQIYRSYRIIQGEPYHK